MSWYDEVRHFSGRRGYDRGIDPRTAAFAGPGLFSPGLLGGAPFVNWRERAAGFDAAERYGRYGDDYGYSQRRRYGSDFRARGMGGLRQDRWRRPGPYDRGWRSW